MLFESPPMHVQRLRLQRGWSQEQLAELSGLSARTIQRIERGQPASLETSKALGAVFNIDISDLKEPQTDMTPKDDINPDEALAFAHVRKIKGFYIHLFQYLVVIFGLAIVNILTSPSYLWFLWPAFGWGLGVAMHGMTIFDRIPFLNAKWEKAQVEKALGRRL